MLNLQSIYFGQKHLTFDFHDMLVIKSIARLAHKHQVQATNDCNGEGWVNNQRYFNGKIDDWAKREYGQDVKSAYIDNTEETIFIKEMDKIETKIEKFIENKPCFKVEFQGDPRGNTVKLYYEGDFIEL